MLLRLETTHVRPMSWGASSIFWAPTRKSDKQFVKKSSVSLCYELRRPEPWGQSGAEVQQWAQNATAGKRGRENIFTCCT